jgi:hypothetical protein
MLNKIVFECEYSTEDMKRFSELNENDTFMFPDSCVLFAKVDILEAIAYIDIPIMGHEGSCDESEDSCDESEKQFCEHGWRLEVPWETEVVPVKLFSTFIGLPEDTAAGMSTPESRLKYGDGYIERRVEEWPPKED